MTQQYYARTDVPYSGGDKIFTITFPYIKKEYIKVFINDVETQNFTFLSDSQIQVNDELQADDIVSVRRYTNKAEKLVTFTDTSILSEQQQNLGSLDF